MLVDLTAVESSVIAAEMLNYLRERILSGTPC